MTKAAQHNRLRILSGIRPVDTVGPKGGKVRRFQTWISRYDNDAWTPTGGGRNDYHGETFSRQWEAAQAARFAAEQCRAIEVVFGALTGKPVRVNQW